ncbi:MAG: hypothetical protein MJZ64_04035 [Paludibacteraceae bacterium]|nr:hypothetical protein [Paludibacteraceae bacterium]
MANSRYYKVAGFVFSITAEQKHLDLLRNYEPFATDTQSQGLLFHLTLGKVEIPSDKVSVFTDTSDDDMPRIEVYRVGTDWLLTIAMTKAGDTCATIRATETFSEATLQVADNATKFAIDNAVMLLFAFTTADKGALEMHASVTVKDGKGFLFLGRSGTGKSTHSRLWMEAFADARLLNDDNPILRLLDNGEIRVYGSPWSGKTPCYINKDVPVGGIVKLNQAPKNEIKQLRLPEAYAYMLSSASGLKIVPEMMDALYATIAGIIQTLPVHTLDCLPDTDAARLCESTVNTPSA